LIKEKIKNFLTEIGHAQLIEFRKSQELPEP